MKDNLVEVYYAGTSQQCKLCHRYREFMGSHGHDYLVCSYCIRDSGRTTCYNGTLLRMQEEKMSDAKIYFVNKVQEGILVDYRIVRSRDAGEVTRYAAILGQYWKAIEVDMIDITPDYNDALQQKKTAMDLTLVERRRLDDQYRALQKEVEKL